MGQVVLSAFKFIEKDGAWLTVDCFRRDTQPVTPAVQPAGIDVNSPLDGVMISILRDGKPALAITPKIASYDGTIPYAGYAGGSEYEPGSYPLGSGATWSALMTALASCGNGFSWQFDGLYSNLTTFTDPGASLGGNGIGQIPPGYLLPVPTKFPPVKITLGQQVSIPIALRCTSYVNNCPWAVIGTDTVTGDDPLQDDTATVSLLGFSDMIGALAGQSVTVQSATLAATGDQYALTEDYGPYELTLDSNGFVQIPVNGTPSVTSGVLTPQIDAVAVSFDEALAMGASTGSGRLRTVYVALRNGQENVFTDFPPIVSRKNAAAFCLRADQTSATVYSEPRNALWQVTSDMRARLKILLLSAFSPFSVQFSRFPTRSASYLYGFKPKLLVYEAQIRVVYQNLDLVWVTAVSTDQMVTVGTDVSIFNQSYPGETNFAIDSSTGSVWYVMAIRSDALSWLGTPSVNNDPDRLPQVLVIRRRDASGASLPFVKAAGAGLAGTLWENVVFVDEPSNGFCGVQILPTGAVLVSCGNTLLQSLDSGTTWTNADTGAAIQALSTQTSGELAGGSEGGTASP